MEKKSEKIVVEISIKERCAGLPLLEGGGAKSVDEISNDEATEED